jgi:hypothetical protein
MKLDEILITKPQISAYLPFYTTTFGSAPSSYNGNIYFPPESGSGFIPSQMIPTTLPTRFLMNDANNNSFGENFLLNFIFKLF